MLTALRDSTAEAERQKQEQVELRAACRDEYARLELQVAQLRAAAADPAAQSDVRCAPAPNFTATLSFLFS